MAQEEFRLSGEDVMKKVKQVLEEGNARRIIVKNDKDQSIAEFPLTVGAVGAILLPVVAAIGAIVALAANCTIVVEKK